MESLPAYFSLNINTLLLLLILIIGGFSAYFYYKRTVPRVKRGIAVFLGIIRGTYLCIILLLLFRPEIMFSWIFSEKKKIALAIDRSASMSIIEHDQNRLQRALTIADKTVKEIKKFADVYVYVFDTKPVVLSDLTRDTTAMGTDITKSLLQIIDQNPDMNSIILLTDGNFTQGLNPLYIDKLKQVNIYPIGIGDSLSAPDLKILNLEYDYIAYEQKPTTITAEISLLGIDSAAVRAVLKKNQTIIQAKRLHVTGDGRIALVSFTFKPEEPGLQKYSVELTPIRQEIILANNVSNLSVDVLKSKTIVGMIAAQPNYDFKFLRQTIDGFEDCETQLYVENPTQGVFDRTVREADVLFIQNFPRAGVAADKSELLKATNKPVCYLLSERLDTDKFQLLQRYFPLDAIQFTEKAPPVQIMQTETAMNNPLMTLYERNDSNERFWIDCPPIEYPFKLVRFAVPVAVLLRTEKTDRTLPVLCAWQNSKLLWMGSGFWRWKFLLTEHREFNDGYERFVYRIIRWMASGKGNQNIILKMPKKVYHVGETVVLPVQLYDGTYHLIENGTAHINIIHNSDTSEVVLSNRGDGNYSAEYVPYKPGMHRFIVSAWINDVSLGRVEEKINVLPTNNEYIYTRQDVDLLKQLARQTGGRYLNESQAPELISALDLSPIKKEEQKTLYIWQNMYLMIILIALFSIEWIIRKRMGLA
jgi:hypothetical protein